VLNAEERKVTAARLKSEKIQRYSLLAGLALLGIFALFIFNRFRVTAKQKKLIETQKEIVEKQKQIVEEKQQEILDSIHYAKRIQSALITSEYYIQKELKKLNSPAAQK
jgi:glycerol-3-phosphate O-acyltransferase